MKTTINIFWVINAVLAICLGFALAVSSPIQKRDYQIFDKGIALVDSLKKIDKMVSKHLFRRMEKSVEDEGNRSIDVVYLKGAFRAIYLTDSINTELARLQKVDKNNQVIFRKLITQYVQKLAEIDTSIAKYGADFLVLPHRNKIGSNQNFQRLEIANYQYFVHGAGQKSLSAMSKKVGEGYEGFLKLSTQAFPETNTVEIGQMYEATMLLGIKPTYIYSPVNVRLNGNTVSEDDYYKGKLNFSLPTTTEKFDENGECRKKWRMEITIMKPLKDTTYIVEKEYIIKKKQ
jgi:hypothetical protein